MAGREHEPPSTRTVNADVATRSQARALIQTRRRDPACGVVPRLRRPRSGSSPCRASRWPLEAVAAGEKPSVLMMAMTASRTELVVFRNAGDGTLK